MVQGTTTDWNLVIQANISLLWCQECMSQDNAGKAVSQLLTEFYRKYENIRPLNVGSLFMAAYLLFLYPQQTEFEALNFDGIQTNKFRIDEGSVSDAKTLCRRIRNSLAHARFTVSKENENIIFEDQRRNGSDKFRATISNYDFGDFINSFMHVAKTQYFKRKDCRMKHRS